MAVEKARASGVAVDMVVVGDDVGVGREKGGKVGRRGEFLGGWDLETDGGRNRGDLLGLEDCRCSGGKGVSKPSERMI
jgi:hypothetical protein